MSAGHAADRFNKPPGRLKWCGVKNSRTLSRHAQGLQICLAANQALHALGLQLIERQRSITVADVLRRDEPLLGLRRTALDNLLQADADKLDAQLLPPWPAVPAAPGAAPTAAAGDPDAARRP